MSFDTPEQDDAEDLPDWLQNLQTGSLDGPSAGAADPGAQSSEPDQDTPDWLDTPVADSAPPPDADDAGSAEDVPDWLQNIRVAEGNTGELPAEAVAEEKPAEGEAPDWLSDIREKEGTTGELPADALPADATDDDASPDWMDSIREQEESSDVAPEPAEETDAESGNFMDRIQELKVEDGLGQEEEQEEDWLSGLGDEDTGSLFMEKEGATEPDAMDWLATEEPAPAESPVANDFSMDELDVDGDKPDWLAGIGDSGSLPGLEDDGTEDVTATSPFGDITADDFDPEITDEIIAAAGSVDEVFPDLPGGPGEGASDLPSWLERVETGSLDPNTLPAADDTAQQEALRSEAFSFSPDEEFSLDDANLPSWLSDIEPEEPQLVEEKEEPRSPTEPATTSAAFAAFDIDDLEADDIGSSDDIAAAGEIERADLPSWLQAMRPVGAVTPAETGEQLAVRGEEETIGPLAGLRGVLPAEPAIVQFGDEVTEQSTRLRILDREHQQAKMLHQLVEMEDKVRPLPREGGLVASRLFKIVIGLIMYSAVFALVFFDFLHISSPPDAFSGSDSAMEISAIYDLLETGLVADLVGGGDGQVPHLRPVLVVFDYEPAYTGEMNAAAGPMILQLAMQNRPLVLISTNPAGSMLAEEFMSLTRSNPDGLGGGVQYTNLGLITGGASGVLAFAEDTRAAVPKTYAGGRSYWEFPPLKQIGDITGFAAVIVLADDAEDAQVWVEQVAPSLHLANIPLIVAASAQAETMLYPYTQTVPTQIDGLVSGMRGGAYYEARMGRNHIVFRYWDGYGIGLTVGVVIIAGSSLLGLAGSLLRKREEEDKA